MTERGDREPDGDALDVPPEQWYALALIVACVAVFLLLTR